MRKRCNNKSIYLSTCLPTTYLLIYLPIYEYTCIEACWKYSVGHEEKMQQQASIVAQTNTFSLKIFKNNKTVIFFPILKEWLVLLNNSFSKNDLESTS